MVVAIFGPTGVGKTQVAICLADRLRARGEAPIAISADALQVYRGLELLTQAPSMSQRARLEHRLVAFVDVCDSFSVGEFMPLAHGEIDEALAANRTPIVVGGTGLYLRAALCDLELRPPAPDELRNRLEAELASVGAGELHRRLADRDPGYAAKVSPRDRTRIVRGLELIEMGSKPPRRDDSELWTKQMRQPTLLVGLTMQRTELYARIDARVDQIAARGGREEVAAAVARGASKTARMAVGFKELEAGDVERMKMRTRNYAKRQLTWMRKLSDVELVDATRASPGDVAARIEALVAQKRKRLPTRFAYSARPDEV